MRAADGSAWEIEGERYDTNPKFLLNEPTIAMVRIWQHWRGGMGGRGPLPDAGGIMDQAAVMMDAMTFMESVAAAEAKRKGQS